jgi:hypothetical protein
VSLDGVLVVVFRVIIRTGPGGTFLTPCNALLFVMTGDYTDGSRGSFPHSGHCNALLFVMTEISRGILYCVLQSKVAKVVSLGSESKKIGERVMYHEKKYLFVTENSSHKNAVCS